MKDIEKAKELLLEPKTLVLVKGDTTYTSELNGIKPLINFISDGYDLKDFSMADKIIGKAQSMLAVKANIKEVYAKVLSISAKTILEKYNIPYTYDVLTEKIINRTKDDICPMEKAVKGIDDIEEAYKILKGRIN